MSRSKIGQWQDLMSEWDALQRRHQSIVTQQESSDSASECLLLENEMQALRVRIAGFVRGQSAQRPAKNREFLLGALVL